MKNLTIPFVLLAVLTLSSCYKTWTCECTTTYTSKKPDTTYSTMDSYELTGFRKAQKKECEDVTKIYFGEEFVNGSFNTSKKCELK